MGGAGGGNARERAGTDGISWRPPLYVRRRRCAPASVYLSASCALLLCRLRLSVCARPQAPTRSTPTTPKREFGLTSPTLRRGRCQATDFTTAGWPHRTQGCCFPSEASRVLLSRVPVTRCGCLLSERDTMLSGGACRGSRVLRPPRDVDAERKLGQKFFSRSGHVALLIGILLGGLRIL